MTISSRFKYLLALLGCVGFASVSLILGQDANWDLKNYHLYNPFAVLNGRLAIDHNAAGLQTYLNPTLDLLTTYPLLHFVGPVGFAFLTAAVQSIVFLLIFLIAMEVLHTTETLSRNEKVFCSIIATFVSCSGALVVSEIGNSMGDLTTAVLNMAAIYMAIRLVGYRQNQSQTALAVVCGLFLGLASGLKLVNFIYAVSLSCAIFLSLSQRRARMSALVLASAGAGFLLSHGWWSVWLWSHYESPFFPWFNSIFKSPFFPETSFHDLRFFPKSMLQRLFYPFYFSWNHQTAEVFFRDFRFPLAYLCVIILTFRQIVVRFFPKICMFVCAKNRAISVAERVQHQFRQNDKLNPIMLLLFSFLIMAYLIWQYMFSIQRYAITLELITPVFVLSSFVILFGRYAPRVFVVFSLVTVIATVPANWGRIGIHARSYALVNNYLRNELRESVVILVDKPTAYLAMSFDVTDSILLADVFNTRDLALAKQRIARAGYSRVIAIVRELSSLDRANNLLTEYGLPLVVHCQSFRTYSGDRFFLCFTSPP